MFGIVGFQTDLQVLCEADIERFRSCLAVARAAFALHCGAAKTGARGEGRTLNLRLRRPTLYPIELLAHDSKTLGHSALGGNRKAQSVG